MNSIIGPDGSVRGVHMFENGFPTAAGIAAAYDAADLRRAIEAYKFFYPTVASEAEIGRAHV